MEARKSETEAEEIVYDLALIQSKGDMSVVVASLKPWCYYGASSN